MSPFVLLLYLVSFGRRKPAFSAHNMFYGTEMVGYTNSDTVMNMYASRLAGACTGRVKMVKVESGRHDGCGGLLAEVLAPFDVRRV